MVEHDKDQKIFFMIEDGFKDFLRYEILMDECFRFAKENSYEFVSNVSCSYARAYLLKKSRT